MKLLEDFWISRMVELNSYNWMGGIITEHYTAFFSNTLKRPNSEETECKMKKTPI